MEFAGLLLAGGMGRGFKSFDEQHTASCLCVRETHNNLASFHGSTFGTAVFPRLVKHLASLPF